jgi:AbrB family looped-hinge helix DNA binding protein
MMTIAEDNKVILKIGSKGEIFPPKEIRKKLGFEPDQPIILYVNKDQLIIRKVYSIEEILKSPPKVKISYHAWKQFKDDLSEEYER